MFRSDFFEFFSRIPWWQPLVIYAPMIVACVGISFWRLPALQVVALYLAGFVGWTLLEYCAHRVLFHYEAKSALGKKLVWFLHGVHHDWPNDRLRLVFPPGLSLPLAALFFFSFTALLGTDLRWPVFAGLVSGYLSYDMIHYATHHFASDNPAFKFLRKYHMAHHFTHELSDTACHPRCGTTSSARHHVAATPEGRRGRPQKAVARSSTSVGPGPSIS
ncbi:MAG: fatty acid hydroxylase [Myxococcales bacterium]|nr:fatty acid hydroxylase [Myxococcales bacterium]